MQRNAQIFALSAKGVHEEWLGQTSGAMGSERDVSLSIFLLEPVALPVRSQSANVQDRASSVPKGAVNRRRRVSVSAEVDTSKVSVEWCSDVSERCIQLYYRQQCENGSLAQNFERELV